MGSPGKLDLSTEDFTVTKPISVFAQESPQLIGRGFSLSEYNLQSGQLYNTVALFRTKAEAEADLADEIEEGYIEEGEFHVTELLIHADGSVFDTFGFEVLSHLSWQNNQTPDQVKECIKGYYQEEERRIRHEADASADGPSHG